MSNWTLHHADNLAVLRTMAADSVDSIVTDPPSGIAFMGKEWDTDKGGRDAWIAWLAAIMREALRVVKPGGHALVWALPRTSHWTATAVEDAGWEIRDVVTHVFGSGFPKSMDISKQIDKTAGAAREVVGSRKRLGGPAGMTAASGWNSGPMADDDATVNVTAPATDEACEWSGWGTALKPANEHWILARRPFKSTVVANVLKHGTGALNIDACRVESPGEKIETHSRSVEASTDRPVYGQFDAMETHQTAGQSLGRWPTNMLASHKQHPVYTVCEDVSNDALRAIHSYYGVDEALRSLRSRVSRDAVADPEPQVLRPGVCWRFPSWSEEGRVGDVDVRPVLCRVPSDSGVGEKRATAVLHEEVSRSLLGAQYQQDGQGSHGEVACRHVGEGCGPVCDGAIFAVEGGPVHLGRLPNRHGSNPARADAVLLPRNDHEEVRSGAPGSDGGSTRQAVDEGRDCAPRERGEDGQPAGELERGGSGSALDCAQGSGARTVSTPSGSGRLEVEAWAIPDGWRHYFVECGLGGCRQVGERKIKGANAKGVPSKGQPKASHVGPVGLASNGDSRQYIDPDGTETVAAWECAPGCPIAELDRQSGERASGGVNGVRVGGENGSMSGANQPRTYTDGRTADTGGASRFLPNFAYEAADFAPFLYSAKPATSEKERGLDGMATRQLDETRDPDAAGANNPRNRGGKQRGNTHPTVKSIALMRWLCRLITPSGGTVLDMFTGSGTTGVAALREGFTFIGIEREAEYVAIARRRIEEDSPLFNRAAA